MIYEEWIIIWINKWKKKKAEIKQAIREIIMEIKTANRSAVRFVSMEVLSKKDIVHQNNVLNLQGKNALGTM